MISPKMTVVRPIPRSTHSSSGVETKMGTITFCFHIDGYYIGMKRCSGLCTFLFLHRPNRIITLCVRKMFIMFMGCVMLGCRTWSSGRRRDSVSVCIS